MDGVRFQQITAAYPRLRIALAGDFCLDRYLEIDPALRESSIETGLPVHNIVGIRSQPGGAGTILNNLVALGVGTVFPVGFAGADGEGFELVRALGGLRGVNLEHFVTTPERGTFTYTKPLVVEPGRAPRELNRLDRKNWSPTPAALSDRFAAALETLASAVDAVILLDQVDVADTGVVTSRVLAAVDRIARARPGLLVIADSRRGLAGFPPVTFKMNAAELAKLSGRAAGSTGETAAQAVALAARNGRRVFVTMAERGLLGASPDGTVEQVPSLPLRGPIDIVGAGDAVTANLGAALAAGATLREAIVIANAAASVVIHQLGTTGTADVRQIGALL